MSATPTGISGRHKKIKVEKIKIKKTKAAASLSQCSSSIIKHLASFLNDDAFIKFCRAAKGLTYTPCEDDLKKRKKADRVKKGLLPHVSVYTLENGKSDPIHQFCNSPGFEIDMLLTKTPFLEGYDSIKFQEFFCFRQYRSVSALQLAAFLGDRFVLDNLLARILKKEHNNKYRAAAFQQLKEVHQRITNQDILLDAVTAIKEIELGENDVVKADAKLRLEKIQQTAEFQKLMSEFINEMDELRLHIANKTAKIQKGRASSSSHHTPESKSETERKVTAENTPIQYADETEALEPVLKLLKAHLYYYLQNPELARQKNWARINQLWEYMGEWHRRLPHYFKQVLFDEKNISSNPLPTFEGAPSRAICRYTQYWNNGPLDLDVLGIGTNQVLGLRPRVCVRDTQSRSLWKCTLCVADMTVVAHLYKLRITGLGNIIELLEHPESANTLVRSFNGVNLSKP